jgi:hypothetical protein
METDLWESQRCQTVWAHTYATSSHATSVPLTATVTICTTAGGCWGYGAETAAIDGWTPMLPFSSGDRAFACGSPANQYAVGGSCTNKITL